MEIVDARGMDCPKPVILTKESVEKGCRDFVVWVDNEVAASNVARFLENSGFSVGRFTLQVQHEQQKMVR